MIKEKVLHYVKYILFSSGLPKEELLKVVQFRYPGCAVKLIEKVKGGSIYRVESPLPERGVD